MEKRWLVLLTFSTSVQSSRSAMSDSLRPHESQHVRPPCPSPTPRVYPNSCPLSRWCHPAISSSVVPFSSCPQSLPASGSFPMSQLMISVRFQGKPFNITVIQVYAPTSKAEEAEVEWFYQDLQDLLELTPKKDVLFTTGDWNAKVGSQETPRVTGKFGLGVQNEAGQRLIEFCQENALVIANTLFQQHKRRNTLHMDITRWQQQNQIDYVLCSQRWRSSI